MRRDKTRASLVETARLISPLLDFEADPGLVRVSSNDTTPNYLENKVTSTDTSVAIVVLNDGADEDLDLSVAVYVAGEIAGHVSDPDAHHAQVHVLATNAGLGADHTMSGATAGHVLRASSATAAAFTQLQHGDLGGVTANQHHNQVHALASTAGLGADHTVSGLTAGQVLRATGASTAAFASLQATDLPAHVLATNTGLGSQHTISGATAGHVLRASSATAAAFSQLQHSDLGGAGANDHHNQSHVLATTSALGADHTVSGLTSGQVLRATGATTAAFGTLQHSQLGGVSANQHHNQSHVLATTSALGPDHTVSGLTARQVLIATGGTTALFRSLQVADLPATYSVRAYRSTDQTIGNATFTTITFDSTRWDNNSFFGLGVLGRVTAQTAGFYLVTGHVRFAGNSTGERVLLLRINTTPIALQEVNASGNSGALEISAATVYYFAASDFAQMQVLQNSGGNLDILSTGNYSAEITMTKIG